MGRAQDVGPGDGLAIIGMACRFPGAPDIDAFWRNLREGVESIRALSESELREAGVGDAELRHARYVRAAALVDGSQLFDAEHFGVTAREAALLSPETRLLIECSEEALQDAGYGARAGGENVGVFVGTGVSSYLLDLATRHTAYDSAQGMALLAGSTSAASRVSYLLDLTGPGITIDTACSSSLVAVHVACRALLNGDCGMALAGGASVRRFGPRGYYSEEGGIFSPDGHCRPFDQAARGTVGASGAGMILLKRLSSAVADGDNIHAIIRGTAINNDGGSRAGYTAPSASGQASAIRRALAAAGVAPSQIQYLETHGTATALGDQIEIAALREVFAAPGAERTGCTLGTLKSNVGHLEAAAGVAGLIKVALALENREMPPAIHFREAAAGLGLEKAALSLNRQAMSWPSTGAPRRAGVSSFGIGGTNAHVIVEEASVQPHDSSHRPAQVLVLSARTEQALRESCRRLAHRLAGGGQLPLADAAYTLQTGRASYSLRDFIVATSTEDAVRRLEARSRSEAPVRRVTSVENPPVVYLFPGQGSQHPGMLAGVCESEPVFRTHLDRCAQLLRPYIDRDLQDLLSAPAETLAQTRWCQPALFALEYSLAQLWQSWGVRPSLMIGHSLGEYVAACLAGVFTLEDALKVVAARGRLMQGTQAGRMLAVRLNANEASRYLKPGCSIATINGPASCVMSGPVLAIEEIKQVVAATGVLCTELRTSHAFHSASMEAIVEDFAGVLHDVRWGEASIPYVSNLTGTVVEGATASSPAYWLSHLRQTVDFAAGLQCAFKGESKVFLEVGPGNVLAGLVRAMPESGRHAIVTSARRDSDETSDAEALMRAAGQLWQRGIDIDWRAFNAGRSTRRVSLPTYPFERQRHWIEPSRGAESPRESAVPMRPPLAEWFHVPVWKERPRLPLPVQQGAVDRAAAVTECGLLIGGSPELEQTWAKRLAASGKRVIRIPMTGAEGGFARAIASVEEQGVAVTSIVYDTEVYAGPESLALPDETRLRRGVYGVIDLCKALAAGRRRAIALTLVTHSAHALAGDDGPDPCGAMLAAIAGVISKELPGIACRSIDVVPGGRNAVWLDALVEEIVAPVKETLVVLRGRHRWTRVFEKLPLPPASDIPLLRARGVYLVTGGLGGIGWTLGEFLARSLQARLIIVSRRAFPERNDWDRCLETRAAADPVCEKIRAIRALERSGAEVLIVSADISCAEDVERTLEQARSRFGQLNGVIHAAGIAGGGAIFLKTRDAAAQVMAPKVAGTWLLYEVCKNLQPDFFLSCSSLASVVSPPGQYDYCAANAYQDAFCHALDGRSRTRFISINWDAWGGVGMAVDTIVPPHMQQQRERDLAEGISCEEGVEVFKRVLANPLPQWIVTARSFQQPGGRNEPAHAAHDRPATAGERPDDAPERGTRSEVARIWTELLGVAASSDDDDFFTLGGDSLLVVQLRTRLEESFSRSVSLAALLREPTLAAMTRLLEDADPQRVALA